MHKMENTPKQLTIFGLIAEGLSVFTYVGLVLIFPFFDRFTFYKDILAEMTASEIESFNYIMYLIYIIVFIFAFVFLVIFIINLIIFTKLIKGIYSKEKAKKVYLYQAIWGGLIMMINLITGVLYLISGIQGYNSLVDKVETREGI